MLIPVRCFTCNAPIAQHWPAYVDFLKDPDGDFDASVTRSSAFDA